MCGSNEINRIRPQPTDNRPQTTLRFFTWDGLDDEGKKARVGIYVVVLEMFDLDGNKDILRAKCVVAMR